MDKRNLLSLGIKEDELISLNGKWVAILLHKGRAGDPELLKENGFVIADEDLLAVQIKANELYPQLDLEHKNGDGKLVKFCHISQELSF